MSTNDTSILPLSERGQITIPKQVRDQISVRYFICRIEGGNIVLRPLQTREDFISDLEKAENDWEKRGGFTLKQMEEKYKL